MATTQPISSVLPASTAAKPSSRNFNDLNSEDFFGLMIAQLQNQDPLKPTDNQTLLNQMSSIRQMEQSSTLNKTLLNLAAGQRFGATSSLIGHYVAGTVKDRDGNGIVIKGVVAGVHFESNGRAILDLHNGRQLPADLVEQVTLVQNLPADLQEQIKHDMASGGDTSGTPATARLLQPNTATVPSGVQTLPRTTTPAAPNDGLVGGFLRSLFGTGAGGGINI